MVLVHGHYGHLAPLLVAFDGAEGHSGKYKLEQLMAARMGRD